MLWKKLNVTLMLITLGSVLFSCSVIPASVKRPCPTPCSSFGPGLGGRCKNLCSNQAWDLTDAQFKAFVEASLNPVKAPATCYSSEDDTALLIFGDEACEEIHCTQDELDRIAHAKFQLETLKREALRSLKAGRKVPLTRP